MISVFLFRFFESCMYVVSMPTTIPCLYTLMIKYILKTWDLLWLWAIIIWYNVGWLIDFLLEKVPSTHTTPFWRLYNVHNVKTTLYGRQNNVVCVLGDFWFTWEIMYNWRLRQI